MLDGVLYAPLLIGLSIPPIGFLVKQKDDSGIESRHSRDISIMTYAASKAAFIDSTK